MKFISEYRDPQKAANTAREIASVLGDEPCTLMEVCGTHTMAIAKFAIKKLLPPGLRLISGPGCPVCVTPNDYIDHAIALSKLPNVAVCTFGDMIRVPGSYTSLENERGTGADIRIVYSTLDALEFAKTEKDKEFVFLGVGFETTAPTIAIAIQMAAAQGIDNFSVLCGHKRVLPALLALFAGHVKINGLILPGHVSAILGAAAYRELFLTKHKCGVVAGFEPQDILDTILELVSMYKRKEFGVKTSYVRAVTEEGNKKAIKCMNEVFDTCDTNWRGLGKIPESGLEIKSNYSKYNAINKFKIPKVDSTEPKGCRCGDILMGKINPAECPLFGKTCTPETPVGACMVSSEGTCSAYYKYD